MTRSPRAAAALALCLLVSGCGQREAVEFNNALVNCKKQLSAAGAALSGALFNANERGKTDPAALRSAYDGLTATLAAVKKEVAALPVPASDSGKALAEGYQRFLKVHEESLNKQLAEAVKLLEDPKQEPLARKGRVRALLGEVGKREQAVLGELRGLQQAFATEHKITLKSEK
jgi:hypothetical protein